MTPDMLPTVVEMLLLQQRKSAWSGTVTLNIKDGRVIAYEVTEKHRL